MPKLNRMYFKKKSPSKRQNWREQFVAMEAFANRLRSQKVK